MPVPGSPEWHARVASMKADEAKDPPQYWYLSFASDTKFLGAVIVWANGPTFALARAHSLGINPGGQVMYFPVGQKQGPHPIDRLLSREDLGPGAKSVGELQDEGIGPGARVKFD